MVTFERIREIALSLDGVEEMPHFDKTSFRIKKKIFLTMNEKENRICVKLSLIDQSAFGVFDPLCIFPVPNKFGNQGWTLIDLARVRDEQVQDAISTAYQEVKSTVKKSKKADL